MAVRLDLSPAAKLDTLVTIEHNNGNDDEDEDKDETSRESVNSRGDNSAAKDKSPNKKSSKKSKAKGPLLSNGGEKEKEGNLIDLGGKSQHSESHGRVQHEHKQGSSRLRDSSSDEGDDDNIRLASEVEKKPGGDKRRGGYGSSPSTNNYSSIVIPPASSSSPLRQQQHQQHHQHHHQSTPPVSSSPALIFCIHGNKFGFARCCDDLRRRKDGGEGEGEEGEEFNDGGDERSPLLSSSSGGMGGSNGTVGVNIRSAAVVATATPGDPHCHRDRHEGIDVVARRKLILASVLCVIFMLVEAVGGILANSLAIATDAAHLMTDFASFLISLLSLWVASRPPTQTMSFGWHRAEVIGAVVSVLMIWVVTGVLLYLAVVRMVSGTYEIDAVIMLITSGVGVVVNIIMGFTLHQHGHGHSHGGGGGHGHSHGGGGGSNINVRAAYIHVIGDFIQSVGVFIAALVIYFKPTWGMADPICTILFSVMVLYTTLRILRDTVVVLMEGLPKGIDYGEVKEIFLAVDGIVAVHNLRIWGLTTEKNAMVVHLAIKPGTNAQEVLKEASFKIRARYDFYEMTLQVEDFQEEMDNCEQCKESI